MFKTAYILGFLLFSTSVLLAALPEGIQLTVGPDGKITALDREGKPVNLDPEQIEELNRRANGKDDNSEEKPEEKPERNRISADGTRMLTEEEFQREQEFLRRQRQRNNIQRNIQDQLRNASGGGLS